MSLCICSLASGSKGNAILIFTDSTKLLLDCGISGRELKSRLADAGFNYSDIDAVLVTHRHSDHIGGLPTVLNGSSKPVYSYGGNQSELGHRLGTGKNLIDIDEFDFFIKDITVSPFIVPHDVHCFGYSFYSRGRKISVVTDLGAMNVSILENIKDSDIVMLESNHDVETLRQNPDYPIRLKKRILSDKGHLSNAVSAHTSSKIAMCGVRQILLAHLSEQNNTSELALSAVTDELVRQGITPGKDVYVDVALQTSISKIYKIG